MIKAILLDLDDTLLGNPTQQFVENYLGALDRSLVASLGGENFIRPLMMATREVVRNQNPLRTNAETFFATFMPYLTVSREQFDQAAAAFYETVYPRLQTITQRRPAAREIVDWLLERDYSVVVATNPFFPQVAIEGRLNWAGLPMHEIPFRLVTTLETMHFSKPNPQYYEEILARLGVQSDEALMVGDDWENDIVPAWQAGLNTFWIHDPQAGSPASQLSIQPDAVGSFDDFVCRVRDENWLETLHPRPLLSTQIVPRLSGNLAALLSVAQNVPAENWAKRPIPGEWTPAEVVYHLRESEIQVQRPRLETIIHEDNPFISSPPPPPGPGARVCPCDGWRVALDFAQERLATINLLAALEESAWERPARHSIFGPTTLLEMANFTAQHDRLHITQLCQTASKCYG